jgi:hypothetical protein
MPTPIFPRFIAIVILSRVFAICGLFFIAAKAPYH